MVSEEDLPPLVLRDAGAEALRLAVVVSAARGVLSPTDLAALDLALRPADKSWGPWTEDAAEAAALSLLPSLAALSLSRGSGNPPSPPPGASSWRATHRRAHHASRDNRLQVAQLVGARVDDDGELWTWGDGAHGLRGDNAGEFVAIVSGRVDPGADPLPPRCEPRRLRLVDARIVPDFPDGSPFPRRVKVAAVAIGGSHVLACDAEGRAWSWGASARGQLGRASRSVPSLGEFVDPTPGLVEFRGASSSIPWSSGSFGGDRCDRCDDGRAPFVVGVAAGSTHCVAIDVAGRAHAWGGNERGQLGLGVDPRVIPGLSGNFTRVIRPLEVTALSDSGVGVVLAAAARFATVFMDEDGRVFASGDVYAAGKNATRRRKFAGCSRRDAAADADADADDAGAGAPRLVPNLPRMIHVSARHEHALMIDRDGGVYAWGNGERGRTGLGRGRVAKTPTVAPVKAARASCGDEHSLVLLRDGRVIGFGAGNDGALPTRGRGRDDDDEDVVRSGARVRFGDTSLTSSPNLRGLSSLLRRARKKGGTSSGDDRLDPVFVATPGACEAVACGGVVYSPSAESPTCASAAVAASDEGGGVYTWGRALPWLGRSDAATEERSRVDVLASSWTRAARPGIVRFDAR